MLGQHPRRERRAARAGAAPRHDGPVDARQGGPGRREPALPRRAAAHERGRRPRRVQAEERLRSARQGTVGGAPAVVIAGQRFIAGTMWFRPDPLARPGRATKRLGAGGGGGGAELVGADVRLRRRGGGSRSRRAASRRSRALRRCRRCRREPKSRAPANDRRRRDVVRAAAPALPDDVVRLERGLGLARREGDRRQDVVPDRGCRCCH